MIRRRRYLISRLQYGFLAWLIVYAVGMLLVMMGAACLPQLLGTSDEALLESSRGLLFFNRHVWPAALVVILFGAVHAILLSHRLVGPLYRVRCVLDDLGRGDVAQVARTRRGDYLEEEVASLNAALTSLNVHLVEAQRRCTELRAELLVRGAPGAPPEEGEALRRLDELEAALAFFRTSGPVEEQRPEERRAA